MLTLVLTLFCLTARAEEGFHSDAPPAALTSAWDSTFLLYFGTTGDIGVASAVVVAQRGDQVDLLTVGHAIEGGCDTKGCSDVRVFANPKIDWDDRNKVSLKPLTRVVTVVDRDPVNDLALIRVSLSGIFHPVRIADRCEQTRATAYAVGFPVIALRTSILNIESPEVLTKRWSTGHVITRATLRTDGQVVFTPGAVGRSVILTSVDGLPGNSGGPLVDETGAVLGLVDRASPDHEYRNRDKNENRQINAVATPCEVLSAFLARGR